MLGKLHRAVRKLLKGVSDQELELRGAERSTLDEILGNGPDQDLVDAEEAHPRKHLRGGREYFTSRKDERTQIADDSALARSHMHMIAQKPAQGKVYKNNGGATFLKIRKAKELYDLAERGEIEKEEVLLMYNAFHSYAPALMEYATHPKVKEMLSNFDNLLDRRYPGIIPQAALRSKK